MKVIFRRNIEHSEVNERIFVPGKTDVTDLTRFSGFQQWWFADMVSSQTNDGDSFFSASECAIEHVATAGFYLPPLLGRFRRGLGGCCDRAEDTLASGNSES